MINALLDFDKASISFFPPSDSFLLPPHLVLIFLNSMKDVCLLAGLHTE